MINAVQTRPDPSRTIEQNTQVFFPLAAFQIIAGGSFLTSSNSIHISIIDLQSLRVTTSHSNKNLARKRAEVLSVINLSSLS